MAANLPNVPIPNGEWVDLHDASGIADGTPIAVENIGDKEIRLCVSDTQPSLTHDAFNLLSRHAEVLRSSAGDSKVWAFCQNTTGKVAVRSLSGATQGLYPLIDAEISGDINIENANLQPSNVGGGGGIAPGDVGQVGGQDSSGDLQPFRVEEDGTQFVADSDMLATFAAHASEFTEHAAVTVNFSSAFDEYATEFAARDLATGTDQDPLAKYKIADIDKPLAVPINYYGFLAVSGKWYILKEDKTATPLTTYRYANGTSGYETAWDGRAGLTYQRLEALTDL